MKDGKTIIPGVRKIGIVPCSSLPPRVDLQGKVGVSILIPEVIENVDFIEVSQCECSHIPDNNGSYDEATLKFSMAYQLNLNTDYAFVVEACAGGSFLIGSREKPYPVVTETLAFNAPDGSASGYEYTVKHKAPSTFLQCIA